MRDLKAEEPDRRSGIYTVEPWIDRRAAHLREHSVQIRRARTAQ